MSDIPASYIEDEIIWEKIILCLESIGVDVEALKIKQEHKMRERQVSNHKIKNNQSTEELLVSPTSSKDAIPPQKSEKDWKKSTAQLNSVSSQHTFVQCIEPQHLFCEFCFKKGSDTENSIMYRCESCGYTCHKVCRYSIKVTCDDLPSPEGSDELGTDFLDSSSTREQTNEEKIRRFEEKIAATQKELDIEMRIRDGLSKITKAKVNLLKRPKKNNDTDTSKQLETSTKKMDILKHELQKCQIQLAALHAAVAAEKKKYETSEGEVISSEPISPEKTSSSRPSEVMKLTAIDPVTKTESIKTFVVTDEMTVRQIVSKAIEKFVLEGIDEDYQITYKSEDADIPLRMDDPIIIPSIDFSQTKFLLSSKTDKSSEGGVIPVV